jgi:hypothetical protein
MAMDVASANVAARPVTAASASPPSVCAIDCRRARYKARSAWTRAMPTALSASNRLARPARSMMSPWKCWTARTSEASQAPPNSTIIDAVVA